MRDPEVGIVLSAFKPGRAKGAKRPVGLTRYSRFSAEIVATDPPSAPVARFARCPDRCSCLRCRTEAAMRQQEFAACAIYRAMAAEKAEGYRTAKRRAG